MCRDRWWEPMFKNTFGLSRLLITSPLVIIFNEGVLKGQVIIWSRYRYFLMQTVFWMGITDSPVFLQSYLCKFKLILYFLSKWPVQNIRQYCVDSVPTEWITHHLAVSCTLYAKDSALALFCTYEQRWSCPFPLSILDILSSLNRF